MKVLFRSCGGLGNQIFQTFFTRLIAEKYGCKYISHYHEPNYDRIAFWEYPSAHPFCQPTLFEKLFIKLRLPKILFRAGLIKKEHVRLGNYIIVDGYFQNRRDYVIFPEEMIKGQIQKIRQEIKNDASDPGLSDKTIYHIRLGDFFKTEEAQIEFVAGIASKLISNSYIISNRDDLFLRDLDFLKICESRNIKFVETSQMDGLSLIKYLSQFKRLVTNGSSLSFASVIFFKQQIDSLDNLETNPHLRESFERLNMLRNSLL